VKHLYVWVLRADRSFRLAGELATTDPVAGGRFESEFEYAREWSTDPTAFPLDPVSLPLQPLGRRFPAEQFYPPLAVFDDCLPDDWGRRLLAQALRLEGLTPTPAELLLRMQGRGTGAVMFTDRPDVTPPEATLNTTNLSALLLAAEAFEAGTLKPSAAFRQLVEGSSRAGGARPKALVHDNQGEWLAKFPSVARDGNLDVVGLEATCLTLARDAGLLVPDLRLQAIGRRRVLLVRRFDVTPQGGRIHMVSMRTLCRERPGIFALSYSELARVIEKHSAAPAADVAMLFRHMVFNAAIGNVDDHLKNFWMQAMPAGYRLAPAFDLVPDITGRGQHTLAFEYDIACPTRQQLRAVAAQWSVAAADEILDRVATAVQRFSATAKKLGIRLTAATESVRADISRRLKLIQGS
jgi:serine/threonine-protein kinase HipA